MSEAYDSIKIVAANRVRHEPFLHILLLAVLGSVLWLAYINKQQYIDSILTVGGWSVAVTLIGIGCSWLAPRLQAQFDATPKLANALEKLAENQESMRSSYYILSRYVASIGENSTRNNNLVLLVEDNSVEAKLIRGICTDVVKKYRLSFRDVDSMSQAFIYLHAACVAIIDVSLPDSSDPATINTLIGFASCPVIVHSGGNYTAETFPRAFAVLKKDYGDGFATLAKALEDAVASTRFPI